MKQFTLEISTVHPVMFEIRTGDGKRIIASNYRKDYEDDRSYRFALEEARRLVALANKASQLQTVL
jgi:hypothetical protein